MQGYSSFYLVFILLLQYLCRSLYTERNVISLEKALAFLALCEDVEILLDDWWLTCAEIETESIMYIVQSHFDKFDEANEYSMSLYCLFRWFITTLYSDLLFSKNDAVSLLDAIRTVSSSIEMERKMNCVSVTTKTSRCESLSLIRKKQSKDFDELLIHDADDEYHNFLYNLEMLRLLYHFKIFIVSLH